MSPIRKGDGTDLSAKGYSEVRKGDGTVLWSAAPAIPDSAILQTKMDEGSGSTLTDSVGSNSATVDGATWVNDSTLVGGFGLSHDGVNDQLTYSSTVSEFSISGTWAYGITLIKDTAGSDEELANHKLADGDVWGTYIDGGEIAFGFFDGASYTSTASASEPSTPYKIRVLVGSNSGEAEMYINNSEATGSSNPISGTNATEFVIGDRIASAESRLSGTVDNGIGYNVAPSAVAADDYNLQPWT